MPETKDEIKWGEDFAEITQSAKRFGVCGFMQRVRFLGLSLDNYSGKLNGFTISHHINGWCFEFKIRTGKFIARY